jgi:hypothetical protein
MAYIEIANDDMTSWLVLAPDEQISGGEAMALLDAKGVCHGVNATRLAEVGQLTGPIRLAVAEGTPVVDGQDARVEYAFRVGRQELRPVIRDDGRADFRNLGLITNVQPGQVLARRVPPVPGREGLTVMGRSIMPVPPRDVHLRAGRGAEVTADGMAVVATIAGNPHCEGSVVLVRQEYVLPGGVSLATGNISFEGDLVVNGPVDAQMEVFATGNVVVHGPVGNAVIRAGGSILVHGGVRQQSTLQAGNDIVARFVEQSTVRCGGSLGLEEDLIHCDVTAGGSVVAGGSIVGGRVHLGERGEARSLGGRLGVPTSITIIAPKPPSEERLALEEERAVIRANLQRIAPAVREANEALRCPHTVTNVEAFRKLLELSSQLMAKDAALERRLQSMSDPPPRHRPRLDVREVIHAGVAIQLGAATLRVSDAYPPGTLFEEAGAVRLVPLV